MKSSPSKILTVLFISSFLERFTYWGFRSLLFLFLISTVNDTDLGLSEDQAFDLIEKYAFLVLIFPLAGGFIADFLLGKTNTLILSVVIISISTLLFSFSHHDYLLYVFGFLAFGAGMFNTSNLALLSRPFENQPEKNSAVYTVNYILISVGAFLGPIAFVYISIDKNWSTGFYILSGIMLALSYFLFLNKKLLQNSKTQTVSNLEVGHHKGFGIAMVLLVILMSLLYWLPFDLLRDFQWELKSSHFGSLNKILAIPLITILIAAILFSILWFKFKINVWYKISTAMFLYAISWQTIGYMASIVSLENIFILLIITQIIIALFEVLFEPSIYALIAQYSPRKLISTSFGLYATSGALSNLLVGYFGQQNETSIPYIVSVSFIAATSIPAIIYFKQRNNKAFESKTNMVK